MALGAAAVAVLLHVIFVQHAGALWRDEVNSANTAASSSIAEMWRRLEFESTPVLSLLVLRGWHAIGAGATDAGLRVFGLLGGLALPASIWFAMRRSARAVPLVSLAILAVNPEVVRWASSVRAWGLGAALAIVTLALIRDAATSLSRRALIWAGCAAVLSVQCVYQNAVFLTAAIAAGVVVALVERRAKVAASLVGIGAIAALSLVPYLGILQRRSAWNALNQGPLTFAMMTDKVWELLWGSGAIVFGCWAALIAAAVILLAARLARGWRPSRDADGSSATFAVVALVASTLGITLFYLTFRYPTQSWYYVAILAIVAVCCETILTTVARTWRGVRLAKVALTIAVLAAGLGPAWTSLVVPQTNVDDAAAQLSAQAAPGDLIVVNPWYVAISFERYYKGQVDVVTLPPIDDHAIHRFDVVKQDMAATAPIAPILARMQHALETGHKVWFVGTVGAQAPGSPPARLPPAPLPDSGWALGPYMMAWTLEAGDVLRDHVLGANQVPPRFHGWPLEDVTVSVFWGWR